MLGWFRRKPPAPKPLYVITEYADGTCRVENTRHAHDPALYSRFPNRPDAVAMVERLIMHSTPVRVTSHYVGEKPDVLTDANVSDITREDTP
jgi:hypothetical protein